MRLVDLSLPLYEGMSAGRLFPQERPFQIEGIMTWEQHGMRMDTYSIYSEQGTRLIMYSIVAPRRDGPKLDEAKIVLQDTVVIDIPKGPGEAITAEDIESAVVKADYREGDALLIRTGWGDNERYRVLGDDYVLKSPYYDGDRTWRKLLEIMTAKRSHLFCYDTANAGNMVKVLEEWLAQKPLPKSWPSPEARAYVKKMAAGLSKRTMVEGGLGLFRMCHAKINLLGGLVNCGEIKKERIKLIALPLKVQGGTMAPCNVVAIEGNKGGVRAAPN